MADGAPFCEKLKTCAFVVVRKKRNCKLNAITGSPYCIQHQRLPDSGDANAEVERRRILCPFDSKHTCYEDNLQRHLKKCNSREKPKPIFYQRGVNCDGENICDKITLKDVTDAKLKFILDRLENAFTEMFSEPVKDELLSSPILESELKNESYGASTTKHLKQNASILGILEKHGLVDADTCFVEFGAGRGQLSHWLIKACKRTADSNSFVLIDRGSQRHKFDNRYNQVVNGPHITRLKIDIEHLNLSLVDVAKERQQVVAVGKHLCGAATDLTLRCLTNFQRTSRTEHNSKVRGVLLALCCHHRCSWASYVGKKYLGDFGFTEEEFNVLTSVSSWATCGAGESGADNGIADICENQRYLELGLPRQRRKEIGFKSKMLLNYGRIAFLNDNTFQSQLIHYVDRDVSPENVALLASIA